MAGKAKLTTEQKEKIRRLRAETNLPYGALAIQFGVSAHTIMRICKPDYYDRQKAANRAYQAANLETIMANKKKTHRSYRIEFHNENDKDVIEFLDKEINIQDYIRQKVKEDILKKNKAKNEK